MTGQRHTSAELACFFGLTALISGVPWSVVLLLGGDTSAPVLLAPYSLGACGPTLAALVCRLLGMRSPRGARWSAARRWAPAAAALAAAPAVAVAMAAALLEAPAADLSGIPQVLDEQGGLVVLLLVYTVTGPLSEEFGWRGFVQPRLRRRLSPPHTALVLGTVWALWHLPLFAMAGTWQSTLSLAEGLIYLIAMVPMSLVYWFVSEHLRGGVPAAVLLHYVGNVSLTLLPLTGLTGLGMYAASWLLLATLVRHPTAQPSRTPLAR